ncbi:hypothetical protein NIES2135_19080 [Leptolyngbya boryana NIES-2135]|jgi:hypothetical protein|uniref:DUF2834 domain-containing protein n=1 Tax=Leptolyngbya boryana NIES-2135 TaxID=1973484 RepID=A0A1Z4JF29_LEPBY|nr:MULTISPECIES: hypothetical protein [Leptolyngbya]BAY55087.1 hypothetical protein NIES2135_19080 [Leptolyngbya boryana NIES-2135]MBD2366067.1 DUF2834 domain-containing protein [Leptolyngbya sp. FACHB-161]MBD2372247.1 DUF2834 domain-containing protein [Leptolyngbya sp. FACHB-238]MBD2396670.1 DUF2834 domain-containing protein [Leptolyngbya sp. FACHB-239]MBD2403193.1 DUF2834 domain-containing protein [Leptolyngbya sp. FACHB-402]
MSKKILLTLVWIGFVSYAFTLAPPQQPDTFDLIINLSTGKIAGVNPLIVALFNIMGVLPMAYSCITFLDGRSQKIPAWLFTLASFGTGAFALLPYLIFRQPSPTFQGQKNWLLKILDSRITGSAIALSGIGLFLYGVMNGDWSNFVQQWQTSRFIHVMSLDFCLLCALFPILLQDDMKRRGLTDSQVFKILSFFPFFGALIYLALRPPTIEQSTPVPSEQVAV